MNTYYQELYDLILATPTINTHSHHIRDERFVGFDLDQVLRTSYVDWCKVQFDDSKESKAAYLDKVKYKSFFRYLQKSLMKIYGFEQELTPDNWEEYSAIIAKKHTDPAWQLDILKNTCNYEKVILDAYWKPGDNNGHPDLFTTTFRVDPEFFGYDKNVLDHDGYNTFAHYGKEFSNIDDFMTFVYTLIKEHIDAGSVCIKNASAYDRGINYENISKTAANKVFEKKNFDAIDVANFQDYFFDGVCKIAAELDVPVQCHTGMGQLGNTRAINMLNIIRNNPNTKFSLMHGSFPWCSDILAYLDMFPNVFSDIVWLPALSPTTGEYMLHQLIEVGTSDRVVWGCDSWNSEESYAARLVMAEVLARVLSEKVERGYFGLREAREMIQKIMHDNAKTLFKIK